MVPVKDENDTVDNKITSFCSSRDTIKRVKGKLYSGRRPSQVALAVKNLPASAGDRRDMGLIPGSGRSPGGGHGNPLQYCMENPMDRGAWRATVHRVTKSWTRLKRLSMQAKLQIWNLPVMRTDRLYSREKMFFIIVNFS